MITELKISVALVGSIVKSIWNIVPILINLLKRPRANIEIKNQNIIVKDSHGIELHIWYPCILISFKQEVKIDVRSIGVNNEALHVILSGDPNYLRQNPKSKEPHTIVNNRIMPFIYSNWGQLTSRSCWFEIKRLEQEVFPLSIDKNRSNFIFNPPKKARVFLPKHKLILSLNIDGAEYQYGISLINACKVFINNLASR